MIVSMDIGLGLIATYVTGQYFQLLWWHFIFISPFFALFPDYDLIYAKLAGGSDHGHKDYFFHWPIVMIPLGFLLGWWFHPWIPWPIIPSHITLHLLHDSVEPDGVIAWKAPIDNKTYYRFSLKHPFYTAHKVIKPNTISGWMSEFYLRPTAESITSMIVLATGIVLTGMYLL